MTLKFKLILFIMLIVFSAAEGSMAQAESNIPVEAKFPHKIVYTTDASFDAAILQKDCAQRGGVFNECGSVCDERKSGEGCISVCAYTCEFDGDKKQAVYIVEEATDDGMIKLPDYQVLRDACSSKQSEACCLASVKIMEEGQYLPDTGETFQATTCPQGYQPNMLKCPDSYRWCIPQKQLKGAAE